MVIIFSDSYNLTTKRGTAAKEFLMKKFRFFFLMMAVFLVMGLSFTACDSGGGGDPTYTVWVTNFAWQSNYEYYGSLNSGGYKAVELSNSEFNTVKNRDYYDVSESRWTADEISNQLVKWGLSSSQAREVTNKLTSSWSHGEFGLRNGSRLYCILK